MGRPIPYYRLSFFYLTYFAALGAFVPYWSVYLGSLDFSPRQIGELMAVVMATKIFAPYIWGLVADKWGNRVTIIRWLSLAAALAFALIFIRQNYFWMMLTMGVFSFFWHATLPQFEAVTLDHLGERRARYSRVRLWGSIGFILSVAGLGYWLGQGSIAVLPYLVTFLLLVVWLTTLLVNDSPHAHHQQLAGSVFQVLKQPLVLVFFIACFLMQASHGSYYTFFSIYLAEHGYSTFVTGQLWALGVVAEIGVFLLVHRWLPGIGAAKLFSFALLVTAIRWLLIGSLVDNLTVLILAQLMHAASYGLFHASAIELLHNFFPGRLQGRGQALYAGLGFGLGNALGSLMAGYVWTGFGSNWAFYLSAMLCLLAFILSLALRRNT